MRSDESFERHSMMDSMSALSPDIQHILVNGERTGELTRVLKHGDLFAVLDHYGDIRPIKTGEEGLYLDGTRFLSCFMLEMDQARPLLLGSTVRDDNDQLIVTLTNPDVFLGDKSKLPGNSLHVSRKLFLFDGVCYQDIRVQNYGFGTVNTLLAIRFAADYADIYEVRGVSRKERGLDLIPDVEDSRVILHYEGLDGELRSTMIEFDPRPDGIDRSCAEFRVSIKPQEIFTILAKVSCKRACRRQPVPLAVEVARKCVLVEIERQQANSCRLYSSNGQFDAWVDRALADLHMMVTHLPTGPYPYAGVPWFNTPFGRDGIITAWECLWMWPELARGVLAYLASTQATAVIPEQEAEPGKILHETRSGEMATLKEIPFGRYYGSVDATPLFVALTSAYYERTGDLSFVEAIWPNVAAALNWITIYGDKDQDGFVEYQRSSAGGLIHQSWKDADDAVFHRDGSHARGAIAMCEVQGYVYAAYRGAAKLAQILGHRKQASDLIERADALHQRFNEMFWCEDLSTYAIALDGEKRRCSVATSNAGQCLFAGIATQERAERIIHTLLASESYSGWGIRTVASSEARFNPMSYHNGSVWPHDNALIAYGMARYGLSQHANRIFKGLFEAAMYFDLHRMPELFCGFAQQAGEGPVPYPVACSPQAWSAASVFLLLQACLGIQVDGIKHQITFLRPTLPDFLNEVRIRNLQVGEEFVDLDILRHEEDVSVTVKGNQQHVAVVIMK